ncbi:MAG: hypothetical protein WDO14_00855 [Bacteroidota bacterium]
MKRIIILSGISAALLILIIGGSIIAIDKTKYNNDFVRVFPPHFTNIVSVQKTKHGRFSIAGFANNKVYLHDRINQFLTIVGSNDTIHASVRIPKGFEIVIDSPYYSLFNGYIPEIRRGKIANWSIDTVLNSLPGFTLMQPISKSTSILRSIDLQQRKSIFLRSDLPKSPKDLLKKQVDGILCTDGFLGYSKEHNGLVYVYRYRNQFLCMDTTLSVLLTGKTIDTTSVAKIAVSEFDGEIKMSKPPLVVNKEISVDGKYLFVHSNLITKNESIDKAESNSVIDIYSILDGHYVCSFYVENSNGAKMKSFKVNRRILVAVFPGEIIRYDLNRQYLPF